ncbi:odorant receptor 283 isoform X1 [Nasonia vitripennis]|uniref:Odorant receptor n=1 Tax=Nasonia vitripennis TaxID=7425 RepID=A0A7M7QQM2_NASVI|nr:odorant receptor 283 isoform X1 [Nasonia vitripennis]
MQIKVVENLTLTKHDIKYFFKENLKLLSKIGFKCSLTKKSEKFKFHHKIPTYIANFCGLIVFALQIYFVIDKIQTNTVLAMQSLSYAVINVQSILKGFMTANSIENIQQIFENLGIFWQKYMSRKPGRELILDRAYKTISLCKFFFVMAIVCYFLFVMQFLIKFSIQYLNREATNHTYDFSNTVDLIKYPFEIPNLPVYFLLISVEINYLFVCIVFWCNTDSLFVTLTSHVYVQFKALKLDTTLAFNNSMLKERSILIDMVNRHRELLRMCYLIEDTYSPIIFSTTLLSALNMCVTVYAYIDKGYYLEMGIPLFLFIGASLQILFYCIFAESLTDETRSVADSVYNLKWTTKDNKIKFYIQMIIMRCQKPFYCTAYGFFPIGHQQLTSIISAAFSYYMMLQTMSN